MYKPGVIWRRFTSHPSLCVIDADFETHLSSSKTREICKMKEKREGRRTRRFLAFITRILPPPPPIPIKKIQQRPLSFTYFFFYFPPPTFPKFVMYCCFDRLLHGNVCLGTKIHLVLGYTRKTDIFFANF